MPSAESENREIDRGTMEKERRKRFKGKDMDIDRDIYREILTDR